MANVSEQDVQQAAPQVSLRMSRCVHELSEARHRHCQLQEEWARIEMLQSVQYQRDQLLRRNWRAMRSVEFEEFLAEVCAALEYGVETTKTTGDQGVDLIVSKDGRRVAVQIKGYYNSVSNKAVQEAYAGMGYYACNACAVITNSRFTPSAKELADRLGCILVDEDQMQSLVMGNLEL